ncbi:importin subunit alpha-4 isoform X2 [Eucalyptus grandis]|uniref:importin subunit alpha-4 isoform X2 n=1 Tax=Eucalyptus grandis TaxID=71139 RepID=UPI00052504D9|nr:importin subunit alpha-4 isoform X2 [Eucalyptus grandis]
MSLSPSGATRKNGYKKGLSGEDARIKREEELVQIRKDKRSEGLKKRRNVSIHRANLRYLQPKLEHLPLMVQAVLSDDSSWYLAATTLIRKLLSTGESPLIDEVVRAGVVHRLVEFLDADAFPLLQTEAAWALVNIASGTPVHTRLIIELGSIPKFVQLLRSLVADVQEQAVWALANIAGDSPNCRDHVLSGGALVPLLAQLDGQPELTLMRSIAWTLSNLYRWKPLPPFEQVKPALPALRRLIKSEDEAVLIDTCWALSFICDGSNHNIQSVLDAGFCPRLVELLVHPSPNVQVPTLKTVGNIVSGNEDQTQFVIEKQGLPPLYQILTENWDRSVKEEACWVITNITAGNRNQIQAVIKANIIPPVVSLLQHAEFKIKKEAAWAISYAVSGGSHEQIEYLVSQGCIKPLCDFLTCSDPEIITVCLDGVESILESGEGNKEPGFHRVNKYLHMIDECEGFNKIVDLQTHMNSEVNKKASDMLDKYWSEKENKEEEEEELHSFDSGADMKLDIGRLSLS